MKLMKKMIAGVLIAVMLTMCMPVSAAIQTYKTIPGWTINTSNENVDADFFIDGSTFKSGKGAFKLVHRGGGWLELVKNVSVQKDKTYTFEFNAKSNNTPKIQAMFNNATRYSLVPLSQTYDWMTFKFDYESKSNGTLQVGFVWEGTTDGFWLDNVCLYDNSDKNKTDLLKSGSFDEGAIIPKETEEKSSDEKTLYINERAINIDGDVSDWNGIAPIEITRVQNWFESETRDLIKGNIRMAHDNENFYMAIEVEDDIHYALPSSSYWEYDGIQMGVATIDEKTGTEFGITYDDKNDNTNVFGTSNMNVKTVRKGNKTLYEIAFPWNVKFSGGRPDKFLFNALINENDGEGREYNLEMTPGISGGKDATQFKIIQPLETFDELGYHVDGANDYIKDVMQSGSVLIRNNSAESKSIRIESNELKLNKSFNIAAGEIETVSFNFLVGSYDDFNIKINLKYDGKEKVIEKTILCSYAAKDFDYLYNKISAYEKELSDLILKCSQKGISTEYESLNHSVIKQFLIYMKDEAEHNDYSRMTRYNKVLTGLYIEAKDSLNAYLKGEKKPLRVPKYISSDIKLDGASVIANTFDGEKEEERPVFFVGYGHWETPREEIEFFPSIGTNIIQAEGIYPLKQAQGEIVLPEDATEFEKAAAELGCIVDYTRLDAMKADLNRAAENNMIISINMHAGIPAFVKTIDPTTGEGGGQFTTINVDHPLVRKYVELSTRIIARYLEECDGVIDVCIGNEPSTNTAKSAYFIPKWQAYIKNLYSTIEKLNEVYGTSYGSFGEVIMPTTLERTPLFYDWMRFNDAIFADFHNWMAEIIHEEAPSLNVQAKVMDYFDYYYYEDWNKGTDIELLDKLDLNGCDAFGYHDWVQHPLRLKMAWHDYMLSAKEAPIWNTEDHIIRDTYAIDYSDLVTAHTAADIWNCGVHGRGASAIWIWDKRDASMPWGAASGYVEKFQNTNFVLRPAEVAEIGKTTLDLNRLSKEVTAILKEDPKVGILFSRTDLAYKDTNSGMTSIDKAYSSAIYNGQKVGFVIDTKPEDMHKYEIIIVPATVNVMSETLENLKKYVADGGKLIIVGENALSRDEHNAEFSKADVEMINSKSILTDTDNVEKMLEKQLKDMDMDKVVLVDSESGEKVTGVEWSYAEYNGNIVINVLNYDWGKNKTVNIIYNDKKVEQFKELRENKEYSNIITLNGYEPVLIKIAK